MVLCCIHRIHVHHQHFLLPHPDCSTIDLSNTNHQHFLLPHPSCIQHLLCTVLCCVHRIHVHHQHFLLPHPYCSTIDLSNTNHQHFLLPRQKGTRDFQDFLKIFFFLFLLFFFLFFQHHGTLNVYGTFNFCAFKSTSHARFRF